MPSSPLPRRKESEETNPQQNATAEVAPGTVQQKPKPAQTNGLAIASLICGGLSLFFGFFTALPAVICGHMALAELNRNPEKYDSSSKAMAIAGVILGYLFIVLTVLVVVVLIFAASASV